MSCTTAAGAWARERAGRRAPRLRVLPVRGVCVSLWRRVVVHSREPCFVSARARWKRLRLARDEPDSVDVCRSPGRKKRPDSGHSLTVRCPCCRVDPAVGQVLLLRGGVGRLVVHRLGAGDARCAASPHPRSPLPIEVVKAGFVSWAGWMGGNFARIPPSCFAGPFATSVLFALESPI